MVLKTGMIKQLKKGSGDFMVRPIIELVTLQNAGGWGCVFLGRIYKNVAPDGLKRRFKKTGHKEKKWSRVLYAGP